ncbi:MAG: hypothetical protein SF172_13305 [Burkholderiales bacterium]|nr:hypothetical protein [Burkholderiales bacterium]
MVPKRPPLPLAGLRGCLRRIVRPAVWLLAAKLWLLAPAALAEAGMSTSPGGQRAAARIDLLVKIPEVLSLHLLEESVALDVTLDDIARGFITTAVSMEVRSNARSGFLLQLRTDPGLSRAGEVEGLGAPVPITAAQASIRLTHHGQPEKSQRYALRVKLSLPPDVQPGRYARPVRVSISA